MSFVSDIFRIIDVIGSRSFEKDKINIDLNHISCLFLRGIDQFEGTLIPKKNNFSLIFYKTGLLGLRGLRLVKTDYNSLNDSVNPEFLDALKKSAVIYMNIFAAAEWRECTEEGRETTKNLFILEKNPKCLFYKHKFEKMENAQSILDWFIRDRNLSMLIIGTVSGIIIGGKEKDLTLFFNTLEEESMEFKNWKTTKKALNKLP